MKKIHVGIISNALWFQAPVKLFQYSAAQLAVVSRRTPTIVELTQNKACYSFFENVDELENTMTMLAQSPELIKEKGQQAQNHIKENFSEENYIQLFHEIFKNIEHN